MVESRLSGPVVVLGSNSFSGASFTAYALERGAEVIGISRSPQPNSVFLPYTWDECGSFQFHQLDINHELAQIIKVVRGERVAVVVNFAAQGMVAESWESPGDWFTTNTLSTIRLHDELRQCESVERYVHVSTPEVYGNCTGLVAEGEPFNPSTPYAVSRAAADMSLRTFNAAYDFPVVTTRAANVYGPGQQLFRIIPRTILSVLTGDKLELHGGGESMRSFIHIRDVANATWKIMLDGAIGEDFHLSAGEAISIRELVGVICDKLDADFDETVTIVGERLGKDSAYLLDSSKVRNELGWNAKVSLSDGLDECIAWVRDNLDLLAAQPSQYVHKP